MWKKTLGLVVLLCAFFITMQGCASSRRGYYRDGYAPVNVRVVRPAYRYYGPNRYYDNHRHNDRKHHRKHRRHDHR